MSTKTYTLYAVELNRQIKRRKLEYEKIKTLAENHKKNIERISKKIKLLKRHIKRVYDREWKVRNIKKAAEEFIGVDLSYKNQSVEAQFGRNLIYKMAMQKGVSGVVVAEVIGCEKGIPYKQRTRFNQQLKNDPYYKQKWDYFSVFLKNYALDNALIL